MHWIMKMSSYEGFVRVFCKGPVYHGIVNLKDKMWTKRMMEKRVK